MHNLAIALHLKGYKVSGSDDEIFEPSKGRLNKYGLLPDSIGWNPDKITDDLEAVILGMHAREDNPELKKAQELGLKIFSYPEYLYEQTKDKIRVVVGGSHGKTSITSMILHVLTQNNINHDYMVGAQLEGFECMVKLSEEAKIVVLEGDEYLSSPIDRRPKFHLYRPNIAIISGIAWDHINVFPTFEIYVDQFAKFIDLIEPNGSLIYFEGDDELKKLAEKARVDIQTTPYSTHPNEIENGVTSIITNGRKTPLEIFGEHNLQNLMGAKLVCKALGVSETDFDKAISSFKGASKRLELVKKNEHTAIFKDFAHSPSKLKATTKAVKAQWPERELIACMELHTFSSLNKEFLQQYKNSMETADKAFVYYSPETIAHKRLEPISEEEVAAAFGSNNVKVFTDSKELLKEIEQFDWNEKNLLLMSSGNFNGVSFEDLAEELIG